MSEYLLDCFLASNFLESSVITNAQFSLNDCKPDFLPADSFQRLATNRGSNCAYKLAPGQK